MTIWVPALAAGGTKYRRLADAIAQAISAGELAVGDKLPPQRRLAYALGVTTGTVTRAYGEAEREGWVEARVGSGTYVRAEAVGHQLSGPLPEASDKAGLLDLGLALPPPTPEREAGLRRAMAVMQSTDMLLTGALDYQPHGGSAEHRAAYAQWLAGAGQEIDADELVVNLGGMNGIALAFASLLSPGDRLATEVLSYPGLISLAQQMQLKTLGLALDEQGIDVEALARRHHQQRFKVLYLMPEYQNPTTVQLSERRRRDLAALAAERDFWLIEDDVLPVAPGTRGTPLYRLAPERTIYLASVSKLLGGGLRSGVMRVPLSIMTRVTVALRNQCWMPPPLMAGLVCEWIESGDAARLSAWQAAEMDARYALAADILQGIDYAGRTGGFYLWLPLPAGLRASTLVDQLARRGLTVTPAEAFCIGSEPAPQAIRVCISAAPTRERLADGLRILRETLRNPDPAFWQTV
ncbi:MAG: PLP-dependent aminotransferase family protein [Salinisphaera sp.]|jgi:DNA-binding transcriptional MocR family regulator|nr:PLP-dependent aminotransferase family protein [Salinisphaera sp.]